MRRLFISFSGGETSAFMTWWLWSNLRHLYDEIVVIFANTGQEREETLEFVERFSRHFGIPVVWVEAVVHHGELRASTHKVVDFESASRNGEPFEEVVREYGVPNQSYPHCTRELKQNSMHHYCREALGWEAGSYDTAIGIRLDEKHRCDPAAKLGRLWYPLVSDVPMTKPRVNRWWREQPFRLGLKGYEGNCKWCWKKSLRKLLTLASERPRDFDFPEKMEERYGAVKKQEGHEDRVFFRQHLNTKDIRRLANSGGFHPATDDSVIYDDQLDLMLDLDEDGGSCGGSSCEPDFLEMAIQ